jgi:type IV pilus assembly protein PilY1
MTTPNRLSLFLTLAGSLGTASVASAQAPDIRNIRPAVMLLVDTSGSMEYRTNVNTENSTTACQGGSCFPECVGSATPAITPTNAAQYKNRWTTVIEALTGTFNDFSCTRYGDVNLGRSNSGSPLPGGATFTYDDRYWMPFHRIDDSAVSAQGTDGILDSYRERVKFGLMTFDGVATLYNQNELLDLSTFALWSTAQQGRFEQYEGGFSYGPNRELYYNGCDQIKIMNSGAKNDDPADVNGAVNDGRLVSVGDENPATLPSLDTINATIQQTLLGTRPYGATPIAGLLDDFRVYLAGEGNSYPPNPDLANPVTNAAGGDPYFLCRPRFGLLLTDGRPDGDFRGAPFNCDDGLSSNGETHRCPYDRPESIVRDLCRPDSSNGGACVSREEGSLIDGLFVVALSVEAPESLSRLDAIADVGGKPSGMTDGSGVLHSAYLANDLDTLKSALSAALDQAAQGATTRTVPAFANVTTGAAVGQHQFSTGFRVSEGIDPDTGALRPWTGILERRSYLCDGSGTDLEETLGPEGHFQNTLNAQSTRRIYTVVPPKATVDEPNPERGWFTGDIANWHTLPGGGAGTAPQVPAASGVTYPTPVSDSELASFDPGNASTFTAALRAVDDTDSLDIMNWMLGAPGTVRETRKLGGIYHSSPVVSGPPSADAADESFNYFRQDAAVALRPTVVYVATIDGILHAFAVTDFDAGSISVDAGEELWGFIPPALLSRLGASRSSYQTLFDGTPVVKEVYMRRSPGQAASPSQYRSVLVAPIGGEAGYVALDVTDPTVPHFLWQFNLPEFFGRTLVQPTITQILMKTDRGLEERAVAILPAGEGEIDAGRANDPANADGCAFAHPFDPSNFQATGGDSTGQVTGAEKGPCWAKRRGRALAMVDVATGELIRLFSDASPDDAVDEPINGAVSVYPGGQSLVSTRAFTTGGSGRVLRIDYSSPSPNDWKIEPFFDPYFDATGKGSLARQPARHAPVISTDESGNVVVIQGTGDIDNLEGTAENRVVSLSEKLTCAGGTSCSWNVSLNWIEVLDKGGQVTGPIEMLDGNVYFATFHSQSNPTNACEFGFSRLWGVSYLREPATSGNPNPGPSPKPALEQTEGSGVFVKFTEPTDYPNQIIMGVGITQRPSCYTTEVDPYAPGRSRVSGQGGGGFVLTAHASGTTSGSGGGNVRVVSRRLPAPQLVTRASGVAGSTD